MSSDTQTTEYSWADLCRAADSDVDFIDDYTFSNGRSFGHYEDQLVGAYEPLDEE